MWLLFATNFLFRAGFRAGLGGQLNQLIQFANSVFIAAIVGAFILVGVIVYQICDRSRE